MRSRRGTGRGENRRTTNRIEIAERYVPSTATARICRTREADADSRPPQPTPCHSRAPERRTSQADRCGRSRMCCRDVMWSATERSRACWVMIVYVAIDQQQGGKAAVAVSHTVSNRLSARTANVINSVRYITIALRLRRCCNGRTGRRHGTRCGVWNERGSGEGCGDERYNGKTYYFCAKACKNKFDADPQRYAK